MMRGALLALLLLPALSEAGVVKRVHDYCYQQFYYANAGREAMKAGVNEKEFCLQESSGKADPDGICRLINKGYKYEIDDPGLMVYFMCVKEMARIESEVK